LLAQTAKARPEDALARAEEGFAKLWLIQRALDIRRRAPAPFAADYEPLAAEGESADHVVAFLRGGTIAVVVPRLVIGLGGNWRHTSVALPRGRWRNELTGEEREGGKAVLDELLVRFPVALLRRR
jgi:(1->4)-alpha-D-glucan 1-alpha-D-glucosylmutase